MQLSPAVLRAYRRRLTNLSSRNRSLLLNTLPVDQFVDLHEANFRLNKPSFDLIVGLIAQKKHVPLCAVSDPRDERANVLSKHLRRLMRTERFIEEERGTEDLYVGWPFVRGRFNDGTPVHGPLLFFPVHLTTEGNEWRLERRGDVPVQFNQSIGLAYSYFNGIRLGDEWTDPDFDHFDKDPLTFRMQLYDWLKSSPYELNFNTQNFTNLLQPFDKQSARSLTELEAVGELKLFPEAVLGIFPQAGSFLVPDYDTMLEEGMRGGEEEREEGNEMEKAIAATTTPSSLPPFPPSSFSPSLLPLAIDAAQERAAMAVKTGQSVVVQGPPGTGKSQLIANLMADAAAAGKRVLLVCQKRAALDVVYKRLADVGMAPFAALIHDFQDDRKALYAQLTAQIDAVEAYRQQNNGLDAVLLDRTFTQESRRIDALVTELQGFKDALFDASVCGLSAKDLYLSSNPAGPTAPMADLYRHFRFDEATDFRDRLGYFITYRDRLGPNHPFASRVSFAPFTGQDIAAVRQTIDEAAQTMPDLLDRAASLMEQRLSWTDVTEQYASRRAVLDDIVQTLTAPTNAQVWPVLTRIGTGALPDPTDTFAEKRTQLGQLEADGLLKTSADTSTLTARLAAGIAARQSVFKWLFYSDKPFLTALATENGLGTSMDDLLTIKQLWESRQVWTTQAMALIEQFTGSCAPAEPATLLTQLQTLETAVVGAHGLYDTLGNLFLPLRNQLKQPIALAAFTQRLTDVRVLLAELATKQQQWQTYLTASQLTTLSANPEHQQALQTALRQDADNLIEQDRLWAAFTTNERTVADRVASVAAFDNGLRLAWIDHLESLYPQLRSVSSLKMEQDEAALQTSIANRQVLTRDILLLKLREQTYRDLVLNRLSNVVSFRDLRHQVTKKRSVWPVRKLMETHFAEVFRLIPCWMASPESVSAIFPMQRDLFDLVIFDEASQCFAENGLPAMLRGRQVVVTGDSKQLRPSDLYRARFDDAETDPDEVPEAAMEVESLLDLAAQYLPQVLLTGHYRSRSLDLIDFSNEHFYNHSLSLLPDFEQANHGEPGIRYRHVSGQWTANRATGAPERDRTNPIEAQAVVDLVAELQTELPGRSVGVVTVNFQQQQLIQDLLEASPHEVLFVKNIENVQGDECDVLLFSVAYAPDSTGRLAAQFGSLNMAGGENRLNVAVTRARERIYVITSLLPNQLVVENTANIGPKLLKVYLQYALDVSQGRYRPTPTPDGDGPRSGQLLKDQLAAEHPNWQPELPFADLTIRDANQYTGLVLTDDATYFQQSPKEAHAYRPIALAERHWPFQRRWSRNHWKNKSNV
ncbi:DUF4011 domain-containing protein [Fibrella sp. HMF5335]|uniref:DUF4011 domain-containing protein n=1 Tax=Fibrella rubiginis TaxID=2817060 RepID=A0A939GDY6_9BACT|nr:AAA domain-containing protein [Fibrella rubiginis]MBO0935070.1 DUF4011 domain-containing protein [Fibrella rubiginis]